MPSVSGNDQYSTGGVVYRHNGEQVEVALILVGPRERWQLPKGTAAKGETPEQTALREVREETGLTAELQEQLDQIEYWFYANRGGRRVRYHKFVTFFLMRYLSGDVQDHDHEVIEARWVEIDHAVDLLAFESERAVLRLARDKIREISR